MASSLNLLSDLHRICVRVLRVEKEENQNLTNSAKKQIIFETFEHHLSKLDKDAEWAVQNGFTDVYKTGLKSVYIPNDFDIRSTINMYFTEE